MSDNSEQKEIVKTFLAGHASCTLVIPRRLAIKYGLQKPAHVILEEKENGIFLRKLELR